MAARRSQKRKKKKAGARPASFHFGLAFKVLGKTYSNVFVHFILFHLPSCPSHHEPGCLFYFFSAVPRGLQYLSSLTRD